MNDTSREKINIIISPIHETYFSGRLWMGIDINKIKQHLENSNSNIKVQIIEFENLLQHVSYMEANTLLFYTSSYDVNYKRYIEDIIYNLHEIRKDLIFIPSYDLLKSFENKGYQELLKERKGIQSLKGFYFGDISDFSSSSLNNYPYVAKLLEGAMSSNVFLVNSFADLKNNIEKRNSINYRLRVKKYLKSYLIKDKAKLAFKNYPQAKENYKKFYTNRVPFIIQEFIEGLDSDYKVLVFAGKYYALKRYVRESDFRASGSGKFVFERPSEHILNFAKEVYEKLDVPFISLDIAEKEGRCYLIEFQGVGFGPVTLEKSKGHYTFSESINGNVEWEFIEESPDLEKEYATSIANFIHRKIASQR